MKSFFRRIVTEIAYGAKRSLCIYFFKGPPSRSLFLLGFAVFIEIKHHMKYSYYRQWRHKESALPVCFFVRGPEWQLSLLLPSATPLHRLLRPPTGNTVCLQCEYQQQLRYKCSGWKKSEIKVLWTFFMTSRPFCDLPRHSWSGKTKT